MLSLTLAWRRAFRRITTVLSAVSIGVAVLFFFLYFVPALIRLRYPFELEWMEGAMVDHMRWILSGQELYQRPSLTFTPFIYPPLYFYVATALTKLFGIGFFPLRLISLFATGGTCAFLFALAYRETRKAWFSLLAPGLFLATYPLSGYWMDLGRVDSLMLFFVVASVFVLRTTKTTKGMILVGILAVLAIFTKQLVWSFYLPLVISLALSRRMKDALTFCLTTGLVGGVALLLLQYQSGGWFWYYAVTIPAQHLWEVAMITYFWTTDILFPVSILCFFVLIFCYLRRYSQTHAWGFYIAIVIGGIAMGWLGRLHTGGYENVLLPTYAVLSLVTVLGVSALQEYAQKRDLPLLEVAAWILLSIQWSHLFYNPFRFIPTQAMRYVQGEFREELKKYPGPILIQSHGFWDGNTATPINAHLMAIADIVRGSDDVMRESLRQEFEGLLARHVYSVIVLDEAYRWERSMIEKYYVLSKELTFSAPWELSGAVTAPARVYVPKN